MDLNPPVLWHGKACKDTRPALNPPQQRLMADNTAPVPSQGTCCPLTAWSHWGRNTKFGKVTFFWTAGIEWGFPTFFPQSGLLTAIPTCRDVRASISQQIPSLGAISPTYIIYLTYMYMYISFFFNMICVTHGEIELFRAAGKGRAELLTGTTIAEGRSMAEAWPLLWGHRCHLREQSRVKMVPQRTNTAQGLWGSGITSGSLFRAWF